MPRSRINGNFIDKTFSIVANILLHIIPTTSEEKEAFTYYRDGGNPTPLGLMGSIREERLHLGINNKKTFFEIIPFPFGLGIKRMVGTTNTHLVCTLDTNITIEAQSEGNYAEALQNYYEAMRLEIDPYDRSYILYNIVMANIGKLWNIIFEH
ncbi:photosystem I assembly protein Ycf3 [Striga asiatica]|uniref:Photosystem I assembly protein Ycf3 n=1 Tax=Striga asiatica TaxID=4170 RepID=A0A5A7RE29_STRAF|nr:photosystem I assembly protein Ycf3 [Striga asiatica]